MSYSYARSYRGGVKAVVFDWAGTTIDYGCLAPAAAFTELFRRHGVEATVAEARGPMGMHKRDHIATMLSMPRLVAQWKQAHGVEPGDSEVEELFQAFIPLQLEVLPAYAQMIPGAVEAVDALREQGLKIGATTGYNEAMMGICADAARLAGYEPDVSIAVTDVPAGRPAPWMAIKAAMALNVYPLESVVKVGDTVTDVEEGLNGGMWTIAVVRHGNEVGLSEAEVNELGPQELARVLGQASMKLAQAGAHYIAETIAEVPALIGEISARLARGERP